MNKTIKYYSLLFDNGKYLEGHEIRVIYEKDDECKMDGYRCAEDIFTIAKILNDYRHRKDKYYKFKLVEVYRN